LIIVSAYKSSFPSADSSGQCPTVNLDSVDAIWRILIGLGCVPGVIGLFFRLTIPETPRFTMDIERNIDRATHDITNVVGGQNEDVDEEAFIQRIDTPRASWADFCAHFSQRKNLRILFGTAYSWFALDVSGSL
jgi:PHS family inorganic phosphate transporter-like MFS transporter